MIKNSLYFVATLLSFFLINVFANNNICLSSRSNNCSCPRGQMEVIENFSMPGSGNNADIVTCQQISNPGNFLDCMNTVTRPPDNCRNCSQTERCLNEDDGIPATVQTGFQAPPNCEYKWRGFHVPTFRRTLANFLENDVIDCTHSMCTSASFLALAAHAKKLRDQGRIDEQAFEELTTFGGPAYQILNTAAEPNQLVERYGLGTGSVQYSSDGSIGTNSDVPKDGDFIQMWRNNNSGHSAIFRGFVDSNGDGNNNLICYWSSQQSTNGYGTRCENISSMDRLLIGSLND